MRHLTCLLLLFWSVAAFGGIADTANRHVIIDYPEPLQKAGIKLVHCIFKDSRGFIWIGAENGLYRFDGTNVDLLGHEPGNPHTIPNNVIVSIAEDKQGQLWVGTLQGAARINARTLQCTVYNKARHNADDEFDLKMFCASDGEIWMGGGAGLCVYDKGNDRFKKVWHNVINNEPNSGYVNCLAEWTGDTLLVGTFHGMVLINKKNRTSRRINPAAKPLTVIRIYVDDQKRAWMGTWGDGLIVSNPACTKFTAVQWKGGKSQSLKNVVTSIVHTNYGNVNRLWVATSVAVYEFRNFRGEPAACSIMPLSNNPSGFINNLFADDEQYIWQSATVPSRFFAGNSLFNPLPLYIEGIGQQLQCLDANGKKLLAVSSWYKNSGLVITDMTGKQLYREAKPVNPDFANISGVATDKFKRLWVSTLGGLMVLTPGYKPITGQPFAGRDQPSGDKTNGIYINHDTVWVACYRHGINLYDLNLHKIKSFARGDGSGIVDDLFNGFFAGSDGTIWAFGDYRLYRYNSHKGNFTVFNFNNEDTQFNVNAIAQQSNGNLLVASSTGLYDFNPSTGAYKRISSPLLSRERQVQSVCLDHRGDVWFTNNDRLVYYQVKQRHFTLFGKEDGLDGRGEAQLLATGDGKSLYMVAGNSVVSFSPDAWVNRAQPPKLYLHSLQVNDSSVNRTEIGSKLLLNFDENKLNLGFGSINYIKPAQTLYAYRLSKVDKRTVVTTDNFASYANLAPGVYTFTVKAENYAGVWSKPMALQIVITPPFWATWWFRLMAGLLVFGSIFFVIRYVTQRNLREKILILEKEKAVEQERNRIARDMHDDLGSGLTKIAVMSEVTKAQLTNRLSATEYLDEISTASRELVDNLQGIIWVLNPQNDSVESLVLYLKEYAESFFEHTPISLQFSYDDGFGRLSLSEEKRRNIFLVIKEACNNALKHSGGTMVTIGIQIKEPLLIATVADNGRGFETGHVALFSNGLQNMKNRIQQVGGEFELSSSPGRSTVVTCRISV